MDTIRIDNKKSYKYVKDRFYSMKSFLVERFGLKHGFFSPKLGSLRSFRSDDEIKLFCSLRYNILKLNSSIEYDSKELDNILGYGLCKMYGVYLSDGVYLTLPHNKLLFQEFYNSLVEEFNLVKLEFYKDFRVIGDVTLSKDLIDEFIGYLNKGCELGKYFIYFDINDGSDFECIVNWIVAKSSMRDTLIPGNFTFNDVPMRLLHEYKNTYILIPVESINKLAIELRKLIGTTIKYCV